jgi:hypothetical protein
MVQITEIILTGLLPEGPTAHFPRPLARLILGSECRRSAILLQLFASQAKFMA